MQHNKAYWNKKYKNAQTGWDIGYISTPIKDYIDQLTDKSLKILVPGAGNSYEVEYLHKKGFFNTYLLEFADIPIANFKKRVPSFPDSHIIKENFFNHIGTYDIIIEQTFFSSLFPLQRVDYATKIHQLLKVKAKLVGVLFSIALYQDKPPYGGNALVYKNLFSRLFVIKKLDVAYNSIKPRANNELFFIFEKK